MYKKKISLVTSCALALNLFLGANVFALEKDTINIKDNSASIEEYAKLLGGTFEKEKITENFGNKNYPKNKYVVKFNGGLEEENGATIEIYENRQEIYINEKYTPLATQEVNGFVVPSDQKIVIEKDKINLPVEFFEKNLSTKLEGKKLKIVLEEEKEEELEQELKTEENTETTDNLETNTAINNTGNTTNTTQNNQTSNNTNSNNSSNNNSSTNNSTSNNNSSSNTQKPSKPNNSNSSNGSNNSNKPSKPSKPSKPNNSTGNSNTETTTPPTTPEVPETPVIPEIPVIPETPVTPNPPESSEPDTSTPDDLQNQYDSSQSEDATNLTNTN